MLKSPPRPEQDIAPVGSPWSQLERLDSEPENLLQRHPAGRNVRAFELGTANVGCVSEMEVRVGKRAESGWMPLERDDLSPVPIFHGVVICGDLHLPRPALSFSPHDPIVLIQSSSKRKAPRTWERERFSAGDDPGMFCGGGVIAIRRDLRIGDARQCELERPEEVLDSLPGCGTSHPKGR